VGIVKEAIRRAIFIYAVFTGHDEFQAVAGSLKFKFLNWLYEGDFDPQFDCVMPDEED
jgi:hypothetical protein